MGFSSGWSFELDGGAESIVACATPPGRGALAVIRASGPDLGGRAARVVSGLDLSRPWAAQLVSVPGVDGDLRERCVGLWYRAPRSYTGEDMVELMVHGSGFVVRRVLELWVEAGCRLARPGELTRRAVANGKMDLLQAEAVADLIDSETRLEYRNARLQLGGGLSREISGVRAALVDLLACLEAAIDFVGTDVRVDIGEMAALRDGALEQLQELLGRSRLGERLRSGVRVVIVGAANAGKSTLFNALLGRERAIVSPVAGTTRDVVEAHIDLGGVRAVVVDTAGLGRSVCDVDIEGMRRAREAARSADVVVEVWAIDGERPEVDVGPEQAVIRVRSKIDLAGCGGPSAVGEGWLGVCAVSGDGIDEVRARIGAVVEADRSGAEDVVAIAARHRDALSRVAELIAESCVAESCVAESCVGGPELGAERVREALEALGEVTGEVGTEEVLDRVFGRFCVGK